MFKFFCKILQHSKINPGSAPCIAYVEVIKTFMKTKENGENIYKMGNAWLRNCRRILAFMKKEIKDAKRETGRKMLGEQLSSF